MFVVRDLLGLGDGIGWSVGQATISEEAAPQRRGFNQALYNAGYSFFGVGLGALIVTTLTAYLGWRWVFPIIGLGHRGRVRRAVRGDARADDARRRDARSIGARRLGCCVSARCLLVTLMGCATLAWLQLSIGYNVLFLTKVRGFSLVEAGTVVSAWGLVGTAGQLLLPVRLGLSGAAPCHTSSAMLCAAVAGALHRRRVRPRRDAAAGRASGFFGFGLESHRHRHLRQRAGAARSCAAPRWG